MFATMLGALVATAVPTVTTTAPKSVIIAPATKRSAAPDMAAMVKMFDTLFPPQPDPDPARLALARTTVTTLVPTDSFGKAVGEMLGGMFERVLEMRESDFPAPKGKATSSKARSTETLHQSLVAKDPYFDERMRLTRAAVTKEFIMYSAIIEPQLREGIARSVARRFDERQLADINAFFATPSGKALGNQFLGLWFDPDLMRSMMKAMPAMIVVMPGSMERIAAATAHLPKPPKREPAAKDKTTK
jgi:hypothetical protein